MYKKYLFLHFEMSGLEREHLMIITFPSSLDIVCMEVMMFLLCQKRKRRGTKLLNLCVIIHQSLICIGLLQDILIMRGYFVPLNQT